MLVYHGGTSSITNPKILTNGFYKDFGFGFYCTNLQKQAERWARTKRREHVVNVYCYTPCSNLVIKSFEQMTEEWLDLVVECRRGMTHSYDIIEGPMADDTIWNYIEDYLSGVIVRSAFWELVKFRYPTHQIAFCSEAALRTLTFQRSYSL